jgi:translocation and assembly module TamB
VTGRRIAWTAGVAAAVLVLAAAMAVVVVRSSWFYRQVHERLVTTLETATGGRVEIGAFRFDWRRLRAEVAGLTLHGTEPAGKPPLLRCATAAVGLNIVSLAKRDVDIRYLEVTAPHVYLIIGPGGRTNMPQPKVKSESNTIETILKLAIGRFDIVQGEFEIESRAATPFDAHGRNLAARLTYNAAGRLYSGTLSVQPLELAWPGWEPFPVTVAANVTLERNRIGIGRADLATGDSEVSFSGAIEDLVSPHGSFRYDARVNNADVARILRTRLLDHGTAQSAGTANWGGGSDFSVSGSLRAYGLDYHDAHVRLRGFEATGALEAKPIGIDLHALRLAGHVAARGHDLPVKGDVPLASLRGRDLSLGGIALALLGGSFRGEGTLRQLERYTVQGEIAGIAARRVVALYSPDPLPWDALASGRVKLEGVLGRAGELRAGAALTISPAFASAPVHGEIEASYDARTGILDLGRSTVSLPSSTATAAGAIGRELRVHLETHDLHDLLPVLGRNASALPVKLAGSAVFDGTVTGKLEDPHVAGRLSAGRFAYQGRDFDGFQAEVTASPENIRLAHASLERDGWRADFQLAVALEDWKAEDNSAVFGYASLAGGVPLADLAALAGQSIPVTGTLGGTAQVAGAVGNPLLQGDIAVRRGSYGEEPFDSLTAHVSYGNRTLEVAAGHLVAGAKQVQLTANYSYQPGNFEKGRLQFQVASNGMPLAEIHTLQARRPGVEGTIQVAARGAFEVPFRIDSLNADIAAHGLQLNGQAVGNLQLTAKSQGPLLSAHMQSDFAASSIEGDGQWRLEGDYPGSATVTFSKLDFAQLRSWLLPAGSSVAADLGGSAAGSIDLKGPALRPEAIEAELRVPELELDLAPANLTLRNAGPIVVSVAHGTATIQSARLTGRNTDLTVTGKVSLEGKRPVSARVAGRVDLAIVHDWNRDFTASGVLEADATVRGSLDAPQIIGRVTFQRAGFNIADVPNGMANANGVIVFSGDRASIQSFSGETGGGRIQLSGFAAYGGGATVFRVHANVEQVRVRYPEGVSTVANANLNFTGSTDRSMLAGTVTVLRTSFNAQSDFSSLIAQSAEPVRAPAARTGFLGGLNFDVNIETSPDVQVQTTLTQNVQVEANLHLRGTVGAPALLGRVIITEGQVVFFGTKYRIDQGSISFFNPLAVEPVLNVDLETKSRGIDVTLTVSGPLNKLGLSYRSDPPLQFSEIVALLATGRTPTADAALMSSENPAAQPFQQMGASALLGQAISSPVTGRLQRFFGVSQLRIDPTLPGVEYNPQARLTLQQQVTQNITFTYITDVTSTNPQVVSVEWAFAKQWSVVAQRDESGEIGMDILFKKRF